jgi:hypothetical protein
MKVLAIIEVEPGGNIDRLRQELPHEIRESWALFASGILREAYATATPSRVVFVLEAENASGAEAHLRALPLVAAGLLRVELVELHPFVNWSALFAR